MSPTLGSTEASEPKDKLLDTASAMNGPRAVANTGRMKTTGGECRPAAAVSTTARDRDNRTLETRCVRIPVTAHWRLTAPSLGAPWTRIRAGFTPTRSMRRDNHGRREPPLLRTRLLDYSHADEGVPTDPRLSVSP